MSNAARKARKKSGKPIDTTKQAARRDAGATPQPAKISRATRARMDAMMLEIVKGMSA
ncbi:hypothetical protein [Frigoribacterium sp. UYMn621]|uniref:hypothetical protein n=1 Tax=Frigoribacterium sp. UYMn621 TaxID=3156343 RepID=UPI00339450EF